MESLKNLIATLGVKRLAIMGGTAAVLIAGLIFLSVRASRPDMGLLFTDLEPAQAQAITEKLRGMNVPFQVTADGAGIMAPLDKLPELRMSLAAEQISGPIGYELLDQQDALGTTAFLQNVNHVRAIEGELARSISSLSAVQRARVHLSIPQRALFEREQRQPSAAITLKTRTRLSSGQVNAIRDMVAASVPGLEPGRISIVDQNGTLLARSGTDDATGLANTLEERRTGIEGRMRQDVETMLERIVGVGKVRVEVAAELDLDTVRQESEVYDPDAQVVARSTTVESGQQSNDSESNGAVTVANNLPEAEAQGTPPGATSTTSSSETSEQVEYQNSRTRTTTMRNAGSIKRLTVAVMVDGVYNGTGENPTYQPRTPEELAQFRRLVQNAIGFNEERGDSVVVENMRFAQAEDPFADEGSFLPLGLKPDNMMRLAEIAIIGVLGLLAFFFIVRPMLKSLRAAADKPAVEPTMDPQLQAPEQRLALAPPEGFQVPQELIERAAAGDEEAIRMIQSMRGQEVGMAVETEIDVAQIEGRLKTSALKKVGDVIERNPNEAVAIIRQWMNT
ncbi:MAG TPA: flagellar basal-body MS-ring/collar protein FliF [Pedomonas sp.]|uniref:flagellar basal-body MS-ring/collar protein FliF n=1 Tax=Pedomonas sp. TaxID=2976421 RepID=UPI002F41F564